MRKSSKALWIALIVVALVCVMALGAMASVESTAVIYGETVNVSASTKTFDVDFKFRENNTEVECGKITLTWDGSKMTASDTAIVAGNALSGAKFESKIENGKAVIAWVGSSIKSEDTTGVLFTVTFENENLANGEVAAVDVAVNNFGYTGAFKAYELATDVVASKAYANANSATSLTWNETVAAIKTPEEFLEQAIMTANGGEDVTITLEIPMHFIPQYYEANNGTHVWDETAQAYKLKASNQTGTHKKTNKYEIRVGTAGLDPDAGTISIQSKLDGTEPMYGITVSRDTVVNLYGKFAINDVKFLTTDATDGTKSSWTSGGVLQFVEGRGVIGDPDGVSNIVTDTSKDELSNNKYENLTHLAGHVEVYAGSYHTISGGYYNSGVTVETPVIKVSGTTKAAYVMGGSHNGNPITGKSTLYIGGNSHISKAAGGSWYAENLQLGGTVTVADNATISNMAVAGAGASKKVSDDAVYTFTMTGGTVTTLSSAMMNGAGKAYANTVINLVGGHISKLYGGMITNFTTFTAKTTDVYSPTSKQCYMEFDGNVEINISNTWGGELNADTGIHGGSYMSNAGSKHKANTTIVFDGTNFRGAKLYGGSLVSDSMYWKQDTGRKDDNGKVIYETTTIANTGCEHSGDTTLILKNGSNITNYSESTENGLMIAGGSLVNSDVSNFDHSGNITIIAKVDENSSASYSVRLTSSLWGGSDIYGTDNTHSGDTEAYINKANYERKSSMWALIAGGSYIHGGTRLSHSGDSLVELTAPYKASDDSSVIGGSYVSCATGDHSGDTTLIAKDYTTTSGQIVGGSLLATTGSKMSGNSKVVIKNKGTFTGDIMGGSYFYTNGVTHAGSSTAEVWGSTTVTSTADNLVYSKGALMGGSYVGSKSNSKQTGDSTLILNDLYYESASKYNFIKTGTSGSGLNKNFFGGVYGSVAGDGKTGAIVMEGDSTVILRRCRLTTQNNSDKMSGSIYAGSYLDRNSVQTGNSKVILDGTTVLNDKGENVTGAGGNHIYITVYGGSFVNGSGGGTYTAHTGTTGVDIISGSNSTATLPNGLAKKTVISASRLYGGSSFGSNTKTQQLSDSTVRFSGTTIHYTGNPEILAGPVYNGEAVKRTVSKPDVIPTYRIIIEEGAEYNGQLYAGAYLDYIGKIDYYANTVITIAGKNVGNLYAGHYNMDTVKSNGTIKKTQANQVGYSIIEIGEKGTVGSSAKFDTARYSSINTFAEGYGSYLKISGNITIDANITSVKFNTLDLYRYTGSAADAIKTKFASDTTTVYEPFNEKDTTLKLVDVPKAGVAPGTDLNTMLPSTVNGYDYKELTKYDAFTVYDNAFKFYRLSDNTEISNILPTDVREIILGVGAKRTGEVAKNQFRISTSSLNLQSSLEYQFKVDENLFKPVSEGGAGFTDPYIVITRHDAITDSDVSTEHLTTIDTEDWKTTGGQRLVYKYNGISPAWMADETYIVIYATKDGKVYQSEPYKYNIVQYCRNQLPKLSSFPVVQKLLVDLLYYGEASQIYINYNTNNLPTALFEEEDFVTYKSLRTNPENINLSEFNGAIRDNEFENQLVKMSGLSLYLYDSISIDFRISVMDKTHLEGLKAKITVPGLGADGIYVFDLVVDDPSTAEVEGNTRYNKTNSATSNYYTYDYYIRFSELNPSHMREYVTLEIYDAEGNRVSESYTSAIGVYADNTITKYSENAVYADLIALLKSMIAYGDSAKAYVSAS